MQVKRIIPCLDVDDGKVVKGVKFEGIREVGDPVEFARRYNDSGRIDTGIDAIEWAVKAAELGAGEILVNSIDADGTGAGYDLELTRRIINAVPVPVIASGGAGTLEQIANVLLSTANPEMDSSLSPDEAPGANAALVASLLHFGKTTVQEIKKYAESKGVCFR